MEVLGRWTLIKIHDMKLPQMLREEASLQIATLEAMFEDKGLANLRERSKDHPAVQRYDHLHQVILGKIEYPDEVSALRFLVSPLLDRTVWAEAPSGGNYWDFVPDAAARSRIKSSIVKADQFHDTLAEVVVWSWLREHLDRVELIEEPGMPDIVVGSGTESEMWVEVKRLRLGKNPERIQDVITHANNQLKKPDPDGAGVVVLSAERPFQRAALDDRIPSDILEYLSQVERRLGSHVGRSVACVVLTWDDFRIDSEPGVGVTYEVRRRSVTREHHSPRRPMKLTSEVFEISPTTSYPVKLRPTSMA